MAQLPTAQLPPSEPRASRAGLAPLAGPQAGTAGLDLLGGGAFDRPARIQMIVALVLALVLIAIPLYLWRRPRAEAEPVANAPGGAPAAALSPSESGVSGPRAADTPATRMTLGEPRVLECHDPGAKRTAAEQCDRLGAFDKAFAKAIEDNT